MVQRLSQIAGSGRETLLECQEWSAGPPCGPGEIERPFWRAKRDWETLLDGSKALPDSREWLGCPPGGPGVVGRPSRRVESVWERLVGPSGCPGVDGKSSKMIRRPSWIAGSSQDAHPKGQKWS